MALDEDPAPRPPPPPPPEDPDPVPYILHYRCACHTMLLVCESLLWKLKLVTKIDQTLAELKRKAGPRDRIHAPTYSPTRWGSISKRLQYTLEKARGRDLPLVPDLESAVKPLEMINTAITRMESDSADMLTVSTVLSEMQQQITSNSSSALLSLKTALVAREHTHYNAYGLIDVVKLLTFSGPATYERKRL